MVHSLFEYRPIYNATLVDDFGDFALHNYALGFVYEFGKYFDFEMNYKFEREKGGKEWSDEHRLEMIPIFNWQWANFNW